MPGRRASPICRASEGRRHDRVPTEGHGRAPGHRGVGGGREADARYRRGRQQASPGPTIAGPAQARHGRLRSRHRLRAFGTRDDGRSRDTDAGHRGRTRGAGPDARLRAARLARAPGDERRADARRRHRLQSRGSASGAGRSAARPLPGLLGRQRLGRGLEGGRARGQERDRLRHGQAPGRRLRHPVGADRDQRQGSAAARDLLQPRRDGARRRGRDPAAGDGAERARRGLGRGPPAGRRGGAFGGCCRVGPRGRHGVAPRRSAALGRLPGQDARGAARPGARG